MEWWRNVLPGARRQAERRGASGAMALIFDSATRNVHAARGVVAAPCPEVCMADETPYSFPPAPTPDASEWPGSPIGVSNTITRTKGRTAVHNKTVDQTPGLLEKLLESVDRRLKRIEGNDAVYQHDVVIHGVRVRATTSSRHLYDFWTDNWYGVE